jgi:excisionase family DNA binding protein
VEPITLNRLATELKLPKDWLRHEAIAGRLPCLRVGRKILFNLSAVNQALADRATKCQEVAMPSDQAPPETTCES